MQKLSKDLSSNYHASVQGVTNAVRRFPQQLQNVNWAALGVTLQQGARQGIQQAQRMAFVS